MTPAEFFEDVELGPGVSLPYFSAQARRPLALVVSINRAVQLVGGHLGVAVYNLWAQSELELHRAHWQASQLGNDHLFYNLQRETIRANQRFVQTGRY